MKNVINYKFVSFLFSWIFPTKETRRVFRNLCNSIEDNKEIPKIFKRYKKIIKKLRNKKQLRVLFLLSENSKWKAQSLYDLMAKSEKFEPVIALTVLKGVHKGLDITRNNIEDDFNYFKNKGMNVIKAYQNNEYLDLKTFKPDIVFYQQPWDIADIQAPKVVSKFALTYYIPYYVNNYELQPIEYEQNLHKHVYKYYVLNKWWEEEYKRKSTLTNVYGLGNPILDNFKLNENNTDDKNYVIYAPHYSFDHELNKNPVNYGTFLQNGKVILDYAKQHREFNWVFKPHPQLKHALLNIGINNKEVESYYKEWKNIRIACYDSSYIELFKNSKLLITDCDSFLLEYFCTSNPIIHLISQKCTISTSEFSKDIFESFYEVRTNEQLIESLDEILINHNDAKKEQRIEILKCCGLLDKNAAQNIINDINKDIKELR